MRVTPFISKARRFGTPGFVLRHPAITAAVAGTVAGGLWGSARGWADYGRGEDDENVWEGIGRASSSATSTALFAGGAAALTAAVASRFHSGLPAVGRAVANRAKGSVAASGAAYKTLIEKGSSQWAAGFKTYGRNPWIALGAGAAVGGAVGAMAGSPTTGAVVGTGVAATAAYAVPAAVSTWSTAKKVPGGRMAIASVLGLSTFAAGAAMTEHEPASMSYATRDGVGGYEVNAAPLDYHERLNAMHATGDLVLGLNNKRHG